MPAPAQDDIPGREAVHWLIALQEAPDDGALRDRFQAWRRRSPAHDLAWQELTRVDGLIAEAANHPATIPLPPRRHRPIALATAFALAASLLLMLLPTLDLRLRADMLTGTGEIRHITLSDGSRVTLAPDSAITVTMSNDARGVALLRGEAFFEVRRDPARPFTATADDSAARVLGTAFNMRRLAGGAEVTVAEGSVLVTRADSQIRLGPGHWVDTSLGEHSAHGTVQAELVAPWRQGQLVVKDRLLTDVVDTLRRYYGGAIVVHGSALAGRRITGIYDLNDPVAALTAMVAPQGGSVFRLTPWVVLVGG